MQSILPVKAENLDKHRSFHQRQCPSLCRTRCGCSYVCHAPLPAAYGFCMLSNTLFIPASSMSLIVPGLVSGEHVFYQEGWEVTWCYPKLAHIHQNSASQRRGAVKQHARHFSVVNVLRRKKNPCKEQRYAAETNSVKYATLTASESSGKVKVSKNKQQQRLNLTSSR